MSGFPLKPTLFSLVFKWVRHAYNNTTTKTTKQQSIVIKSWQKVILFIYVTFRGQTKRIFLFYIMPHRRSEKPPFSNIALRLLCPGGFPVERKSIYLTTMLCIHITYTTVVLKWVIKTTAFPPQYNGMKISTFAPYQIPTDQSALQSILLWLDKHFSLSSLIQYLPLSNNSQWCLTRTFCPKKLIKNFTDVHFNNAHYIVCGFRNCECYVCVCGIRVTKIEGSCWNEKDHCEKVTHSYHSVGVYINYRITQSFLLPLFIYIYIGDVDISYIILLLVFFP